MTPEERYKEAMEHHADYHCSIHSSIISMQAESFLMGCAHAEKEAYNRAIEEAIVRIELYLEGEPSFDLKSELEKLKKV